MAGEGGRETRRNPQSFPAKKTTTNISRCQRCRRDEERRKTFEHNMRNILQTKRKKKKERKKIFKETKRLKMRGNSMLLAVPAPAAFLTQQTNQQKRNRKDKKETIFVGIEND